MKKFEGDAQNTPMSEILKALGYSYRDARHWNPRVGKKEIYPSELDKGDIIEESEVVFIGDALETWNWLVETGRVEVEEDAK